MCMLAHSTAAESNYTVMCWLAEKMYSCIPNLLYGNVPTNEVGNVPNWLGGNTIQSIMLLPGIALVLAFAWG